jgi:hypothetical protein
MSTDLVQRLRQAATGNIPYINQLLTEAADEIEYRRRISGVASLGQSYAEIAQTARHETPVDAGHNG